MATLSEEAKAYIPPQTKNIADLEIVEVTSKVEDREAKDNEDKPFKYKVIVVDGIDYRVPNSVLAALKDILAKKPTLQSFSVTKTGTGLNTKYTVIPQI